MRKYLFIWLKGFGFVQKLLEKIKSCFGAVSGSQAVTNFKRQAVENNQT